MIWRQIRLLEHLRVYLIKKIKVLTVRNRRDIKRKITILKIVRNGTSKAQNFKTAQKQA